MTKDEEPTEPEDDFELAPETVEDLDADDADEIAGGGYGVVNRSVRVAGDC